MFQTEVVIRVRYAETDRMGYVYYGNYPTYLEIARVEALRTLGFSYKKMEDDGIMLPVASLNIKYIKPAFYDDLITVKTIIAEIPNVKINFTYEMYNQHDVLLNKAETTLVFVNVLTQKPTSAPTAFISLISPFFV